MTTHCPRCQSPAPHLHPAVQVEGEVETCTHEFHLRQTPQNLPRYREAVLRKLEAQAAEARGLFSA